MARRLLLVNPVQKADFNMSVIPIVRFPPTNLAYLAALTPSHWDVRIIDETIEPIAYGDADLVGLTAMTSNAPRAYEIAGQCRRNGIKTVMGGVHASVLCDEALEFVDSVVVGEAESVWPDLLHDFERDELRRLYRGERRSLQNLATPRRGLCSNKYTIRACVETSRGCPNDCEFCVATTLNGRRHRQRPIEEVLNELEGLDCKYFIFLDDNILGYGQRAEERAIRLFRGMKERGLDKRWASQVGIDFANNREVLRSAREAGCVGVFVGFESLNEESLRSMHKVRNLKVGTEKYKEVIKTIHDHGIAVHGGFAVGGDGDRKDVFERTIEFILDSKLDTSQSTIMTPFPGTRMYDRLKSEGRLLRTDYPHDWRHYDLTEAVFRPKHMTAEELEEGVAEIYRHTTSRLTSLRRALVSLVGTRNLAGAAVAYLYNRGSGPLWLRKHEQIKNALPARVTDAPALERPFCQENGRTASVEDGVEQVVGSERR